MFHTFLKNIKSINSITLTFLIGFYYLIGLNFLMTAKIYSIINDLDYISPVFIATVPILFISAFIFIFTPLISKFIAKPLLVFLILSSSCINYGAYNFGVIFNQDMMLNIFETAPKEATSYLNLKLIIWIFLSGILPSLYIIFVKIEYRPFLKEVMMKAFLMLSCLAVVFIIAFFFYKDYASIARNNAKLQKYIIPTYYISSTIKYIKNNYFNAPLPYIKIGADAKRRIEKEKYLIVVLVGETARAQNYQLNGYNRKTNAYTSTINNLVYFKNSTSCGTATAVSLPCMFSMMDRSNYSREKFNSQDNLIDIIKRSGYKQIWIDNNTGCKGICKNIENYTTTQMPELDCTGEECTDLVFLDILNEKIQSLNSEDGVIYLHLLGSHGPSYYKRYPQEYAKFKPECETSNLQYCNTEEIVNTYDNTILFTDFVMSKVISDLDKYKDNYHTSVLYISDHGESLGEKGLYLHGMPYSIAPKEQTHVPFMAWFSESMIKHENIDMECLKKEGEKGGFSHDNLSHTILDLLDISTESYDESKNIFIKCIDEN